MESPHTKIIKPINEGAGVSAHRYKFEIKEEDVANLNLVSIAGKIYPVYKDYIGYYILINNKRVSNGEIV